MIWWVLLGLIGLFSWLTLRWWASLAITGGFAYLYWKAGLI